MGTQSSISYLGDSNTTRYNKLPNLPPMPLVIAGIIMALIGLIYTVLVALYLLMVYDPSYGVSSVVGAVKNVAKVIDASVPESKLFIQSSGTKHLVLTNGKHSPLYAYFR